MGFLTWRNTRTTRREVRGLRADQQAAAEQHAAADLVALFQQLPPEGKADYRALEAECAPKWSDGMIQQARKQKRLSEGRAEILRRYDLIP